MDLMRLLARPPTLPATLLPCVDDLIAVERPDVPMHCLRPAAITGAATAFLAGFPGAVLYAVKCNPDPAVACGISTAPRHPRWRWCAACSPTPSCTSCIR